MCGIVAYAGNLESPAPLVPLERMTAALRARGPDADGVWRRADGRVGLGHRRLAVIDLHARSGQPMHHPVRDCHIVFNGEIYNYAELRRELAREGRLFQTEGDTEVLLAAYEAWGVRCLERLAGMFAFVLYDGDAGIVLAARDRAGEKPLYYRIHEGQWRAASELKGLLADEGLPRRVRREALAALLRNGYAPVGDSLLEGFGKLPPAHYGIWTLATGRWEVRRYWSLPESPVPDVDTGRERWLGELDGVLAGAVGRQLVANVPTGVLLSGGVDSSLIASYAAQRQSGIQTFTVGFPGSGLLDERVHAGLVARHLGTRHHEILVEEPSLEDFRWVMAYCDEPILDASIFPTALLCRAVRQHCTVVLGGDGGDELFSGYWHHQHWVPPFSGYMRLPAWWREKVAALAQSAMPSGMRARHGLMFHGFHWEKGHFPARYFDENECRRLLSGEPLRGVPGLETVRLANNQRPLDALLRHDFSHYLPGDILTKTDRASMMSSLELRAPFLDLAVIEWAFGALPSALKTGTFGLKDPLRRLVAGKLPKGFEVRRKQGFSMPVDRVLRGAWREEVEGFVAMPTHPWLEMAEVRKLWQGFLRGRRNGQKILALLMLDVWRRQQGMEDRLA